MLTETEFERIKTALELMRFPNPTYVHRRELDDVLTLLKLYVESDREHYQKAIETVIDED